MVVVSSADRANGMARAPVQVVPTGLGPSGSLNGRRVTRASRSMDGRDQSPEIDGPSRRMDSTNRRIALAEVARRMGTAGRSTASISSPVRGSDGATVGLVIRMAVAEASPPSVTVRFSLPP